jgi:EAL domain-containing protein (putative c-di-GMP-specific phosphodiesterase class I)
MDSWGSAFVEAPERAGPAPDWASPAKDCEPESAACAWYLIGRRAQEDMLQSIPVSASPFWIGRRPDMSLCLSPRTVSSVHAVLHQDEDLLVRDLGSTNGTFVNGRRVLEDTRLGAGDLLQFADVAFRVQPESAGRTSATQDMDVEDQALALIQFEKLLSTRSLVPHYQPIVTLPDKLTIGFESLARSRLYGLRFPASIFGAAAHFHREAETSCLLRHYAVTQARHLSGHFALFLNTHPAELHDSSLLESLRLLRESAGAIPLVLEIHEAAVTSPAALRELKAALAGLDIRLAYDDFGAGHARLLEISDAPPDFLKFDRKLIRGIDTAPASRWRLLSDLLRLGGDLQIEGIAEGVETAGEAAACEDLGFRLAQGFQFGKPLPASAYRGRNQAPPAGRHQV